MSFLAFTAPHASNNKVLGVPVPDVGVTETISNLLGGGRTAQGGSNLSNNGGLPTAQVQNGSGGFSALYGPALGWNGSNDVYNPKILGVNDTSNNGSNNNNNQQQKQQAPVVQRNPGDMVNSGDYGDTNPGMKSWATILEETGGTGRYGGGGGGPDYGQINSIFDEINGLLNGQENQLQSGKQDFLNQYTAPFDPLYGSLDTSYQTGKQLNDTQRGQVLGREQNALSDARNLYSELSQANQQRFGGSSSAGQFSDQILGRQFMKNQGQINQTTSNDLQSVQQRASDLYNNYTSQKADLDSQKAQALNQAQSIFQQKLDSINNARIGNAQNKASAKLSALQELRQNSMNINNMFLQSELSLKAQAQQASQNLSNAIALYKTQAGQPVDLSQMQSLYMPQFGGGTQQVATTATGQLGSKLKYNPLTGKYEATS